MYLSTSAVLSSLLAITTTVLASPVPRSTHHNNNNLSPCCAAKRAIGSWPSPEPSTGNLTGVHDPSLIQRDDGKWYRLSTNGNIAIASASDISGPWEYEGALLPEGSKIDTGLEDQELWAPDVTKVGDTYYAYYSVSKRGSQKSQIGVATSKTLEAGSWTDQGSLNLPKSNNYNLIDPNYFTSSADAQPDLVFGSGWDGIYTIKLNDDLTGRDISSTPTRIADNSTGTVTEGGFLFHWTVDSTKYYYLFFSNGKANFQKGIPNQGEEYKVYVCRSESPTGPFKGIAGKDCTSSGGNLVLGSHDDVFAPGGQGVLAAGVEKPILYYHYVNTTLDVDDPYYYTNYQFGYNYLDFSNGWPSITSLNDVTNGTNSSSSSSPTRPSYPGATSTECPEKCPEPKKSSASSNKLADLSNSSASFALLVVITTCFVNGFGLQVV